MTAPILTLAWAGAGASTAIAVPDLDGVRPGTVEVLVCVHGESPASLPQGVRVVRVPGARLVRSRNAAIQHARGRYLMFCDEGTVSLDGAMTTVRYLARTGRALALGPATDPQRAPRRRHPSVPQPLGLHDATRAAASELVIDVDAVRAAGLGFDERLGTGVGLPLGVTARFVADLLRAGLHADTVPWGLAARAPSAAVQGDDAQHRAPALQRLIGPAALGVRALLAPRRPRRQGTPHPIAALHLDRAPQPLA